MNIFLFLRLHVARKFALIIVGFISLLTAACGMFSDKHDYVLEGSLTLTPLRLPKEVAAPDNRNAMHIPEVPYNYESNIDQASLEKPPMLDTALANELEKKLGSDVDQKKLDVKSFPVSMIDGDGGIAELDVSGEFDLLWPYMENVLEKLGFKITDHDRSEHRYYISRQLPITAEEKEQLKQTGVERTIGNTESYQIEVAPKETAANAASGKMSIIRIRNNLGQLENSSLSRHMLAQIKAYLQQPLQ